MNLDGRTRKSPFTWEGSVSRPEAEAWRALLEETLGLLDWSGSERCKVCKGDPRYQHPVAGYCGLAWASFDFTISDQWMTPTKLDQTKAGWREPTFADLDMAFRDWAPSQQFAFVFFGESGDGKGVRVLHPHAHGLAVGWRCTFEVGRVRWCERYCRDHKGMVNMRGAWESRIFPLEARSEAQEEYFQDRMRYITKHHTKQHQPGYVAAADLPVWAKLRCGPYKLGKQRNPPSGILEKLL